MTSTLLNGFSGYDNIENTSLKTIQINSKDLGEEPYSRYPQIGCGDEGAVHRYNESKAIKIFCNLREELLRNKFEKLELLGKIKDESFEFPELLVGFENSKKAGFLMNLVNAKDSYKKYIDLISLFDTSKAIRYLLKAEEAMIRIHRRGIVIGDIKGSNIMIDENDNPRFIDTDNYAIGDFGFDLIPYATKVYESFFNTKCSPVNNDKFTFAILSLQIFSNGILSMYSSLRNLNIFMEYLDIDQYSREVLRAIFSDSQDKPYISEMLRQVDTNRPLIKKEHTYDVCKLM